jgi:hypothetical protein
MDECRTKQHNCHQNTVCSDTDGSFQCECFVWFETEDNGVTCSLTPALAVLSFTATLDMTLAEFEQGRRAKYKATMASVANVTVEKVSTDTLSELLALLILAASIQVHTTAEVAVDSSAETSSRLTS